MSDQGAKGVRVELVVARARQDGNPCQRDNLLDLVPGMEGREVVLAHEQHEVGLRRKRIFKVAKGENGKGGLFPEHLDVGDRKGRQGSRGKPAHL